MSVSIFFWRSRRPQRRETQPGAQPRSLWSLDAARRNRAAPVSFTLGITIAAFRSLVGMLIALASGI